MIFLIFYFNHWTETSIKFAICPKLFQNCTIIGCIPSSSPAFLMIKIANFILIISQESWPGCGLKFWILVFGIEIFDKNRYFFIFEEKFLTAPQPFRTLVGVFFWEWFYFCNDIQAGKSNAQNWNFQKLPIFSVNSSR